MLNLNLNLKLNDLKSDTSTLADIECAQVKEAEGIAVIGMNAKVGSALTKEELWQAFANGLDMIGKFPDERAADAQRFSHAVNGRAVQRFSERAYLPWIDKFDPGVFKIAPTEAELMDPVHRLYLESAWTALEDAGYGGESLRGSKTGVYVGYNNVGEGYEVFLKDAPKETLGIMLSGNVSSFLASRLSYLLDLRGPAMVIDTACSSSLVALHEACKALKSGEIRAAVVGSIRIFFCPEHSGEDIGTTSSSERTKTFDETADGTGGGEGVINLVLKPLQRAIDDGDHIYGVIKGSCANQDGSSIGITAPNSAAQEAAIVQAWQEAQIDPEEVSYIEAHGTATKLGDPVELGGLTAAFGRFTQKKQFCAIGASKSNFGHLDCASGLLGVVKVLLMMQHKMLPPTLHFASPNRKIDYIASPVYVNDTLKPWETQNGILTAGVSSFGLSGTNCHVVLQSFESKPASAGGGKHLLTASALDKDTLRTLLLSYQSYLKTNADLSDFCYTVNTGRGQYRCRFAMVLESAEEFLALSEDELVKEPFYGEFRIVSETAQKADGFLTVAMQERLSEKAECSEDLFELAELYLSGAQINFKRLYEGRSCSKLPLPTYPFRYQRCWYEAPAPQKQIAPTTEAMHPLLDRLCVKSYGVSVYEKRITLDRCMELREHRINGVCVMPGTVYVEIARAIGADLFGSNHFVFTNVTFFSLMTCGENEERILHAIVREENGELHITMASRGADDAWIDHIEAVLKRENMPRREESIDLSVLLHTYPQVYTQNSQEESSGFVHLGEHWQTGCMLYVNDKSVVLQSDVPQRFRQEAAAYELYPPLLDGSVNSGIMLLDGQYLPLSYKNARFTGKLNELTYSVITRKEMDEQTDEIALFHIQMFDRNGRKIGQIEEYALKRVNQAERFLKNETNDSLYQIEWVSAPVQMQQPIDVQNAVVFLRKEQAVLPIVAELKKRCAKTVLLFIGEETVQTGDTEYTVRCDESEITELLCRLVSLKHTTIINLLSYCADGENLAEELKMKLQTGFFIAKALGNCPQKKVYATLCLNASSITGAEGAVHPLNQALIGLNSCIEPEQANTDVCILDADERSDAEMLAAELLSVHDKMVVGIRDNQHYIERMCLARKKAPMEILDGDVIVIAGGCGGIGLALSEHIFSRCPNAKLVLLSRNAANADDERKSALDRMVAAGCSVEVMSTDVSDETAVFTAMRAVREKYGRIDGVIHAAGVAGDGMLINKAWQTALNVLRPKILGAWNLHQATKNDALRCFVLLSSFTSVLGAPGQADYTAANAYLDSFTFERNRLGYPTMTINFTGWKESGMAKKHHVQWEDSFVSFVTDEEGKRLFADAMEFGCERVAACSFRSDLPVREADRLERRLTLPKGVIKIEQQAAIQQDEAPIIYGKAVDKLTAVEQNIALAWARTLHVSEVNIYDKFFEAGGNSLLASYLQKEINRIYPDAMAITDVFVYSTIADIAAYISGKLGLSSPQTEEVASDAQLEDLVQQFMSGKLSLEEMENLV